MKEDITNRKLDFELVIRTGGYQIVLDGPEGAVSLTKMREASDWHISLRRKHGRCTTC
jgi:hypothetical protein